MTTARDFARHARSVRFDDVADRVARVALVVDGKPDMRCLSAVDAIREALLSSDDLRKPEWRGHRRPTAGHCYVASEALWHALGGMQSEWRPEVISTSGGTHWYLRSKRTRLVMDPTGDQFDWAPPYHAGRGCGFLTKQPSKRAAELLKRARLEVAS